MGWGHQNISLEELMKLIKGFLDIVILASGYQSTGLLAYWDSSNIKKALQWALFFENVFRSSSASTAYEDSIKELDDALAEMKAHPCFPQGLAHLSSATLTKAREFVLEHLIHTLPLRDAHLNAVMTAAVEMDLDKLSEIDHDCVAVYLNKLSLQNASFKRVGDWRDFTEDMIATVPDTAPTKTEKCITDDFTMVIVEKLLKRKSAVSCLLSAMTCLDNLSNTIICRKWNESNNSLFDEKIKQENDPVIVDWLIDFKTWNDWKSRTLSYFLDKRTVRMVSGASMIFSAPKIQWGQVLERLKSSMAGSDDTNEIIELLLLGCVAKRWSFLIDHFIAVPYNPLPLSKQYYEVCNLILGRSQTFHSKEDMMNSRESSILEYLTALMGSQIHQLWKVSPVLAAAAIPSWSPLFRLYLSELDTQLKVDSSTLRCCSCAQDRVDHKNCELAERIWCLHIFHVCGSHLMNDSTKA